jgi:hypothetical protein
MAALSDDCKRIEVISIDGSSLMPSYLEKDSDREG